jgi:hypothetical protein
MSAAAALLALLLLLAIVALVSAPLRRAAAAADGRSGRPRRLPRPRPGEAAGALHAAREAKYREIREAELDWRMGKLTDADYAAVTRVLRAEALEILNSIEARAPGDASGSPREDAARSARGGAAAGAQGDASSSAQAPAPASGSVRASGEVEQRDRVREEEDGEEDRPAVQVALDHRAAAERPDARADAEGAGEAGVLAGVHEHEQDEHHRDQHLEGREDRVHAVQDTR